MMSDPSLQQLQQWMESIITTQGTLQQKVYHTAIQQHLLPQEVVVESRGISAIQRLHIYANGYVARLRECLQADFPLLRQFMTDRVFDHFATAYIHYSKPSSYTLFDLSNDFPQFLLDTRPQTNRDNNSDHFFDFPYALACYEQAVLSVYRAKGLEVDDASLLGNYSVYDEHFFCISIAMIETPACVECLKIAFPMLTVIEKLEQEKSFTLPDPKITYLAIYRKNYRVLTMELDAWQYHFLQAAKKPIGTSQAAKISAKKSGIAIDEILADLIFFMPEMMALGLLNQK